MTDATSVTLTYVDGSGVRHSLPAKIGLSVMEVLQTAGFLEGECSGSLACATCHVWVNPAKTALFEDPTEDEEDMLDVAFHVRPNSRLSCQLMVTDQTDGLEVTQPTADPGG